MGTLSVNNSAYQEQALKALDSLPPFSPILNRLLATLADENVSFARLAALIEKDTVLAGNVLRVVNSALYGCRGTINSVAHAIAIMGMVKLRNTALSFSVARLWRGVRTSRSWSMVNFNLHSIAVAIMSDSIAQRTDVYYPEGAFVAGLFHDIGKLLLAVGAPEEYEHVIVTQIDGEGNREQREREFTGTTHADLSAMALQKWNLPRPIQLGVAFHHDPASAPPDARNDCKFGIADVVNAADDIVNSLGITVVKAAEGIETVPDESTFERFGLTPRATELLRDFQQEYEAVKNLF